MQKALIYCRVSTEEQANEGYSLDAQQKLCSKFAEENGYQVSEVFRDEGKSGTNLNRPALQSLLSKCQEDRSIKAVIIQDTDRLARNAQNHLYIRMFLKKAGIQFISVSQPMINDSAEGNMIDTILASVNQFQSDQNSQKTKKGLQEKFEQGYWPGWAPLGYLNREVNGQKIAVPDPNKWNLLKSGFKMYLTGNYSVVEIAETLYKKGLLSKTGVKIPYSIMTHILKNPFYAGIMKWNGQEKIGKHQAMISSEEHRQIVTIMDSHNYHACRKRKHNFLLRGFVFCDICGQRYTADRHRANKISDYYHCSARSIQHSNKNQNVKTDILEKQVENLFKGIEFNKEFISLVIEKVKKFYQEKRKDDELRKRVLLNKKMDVEEKRKTAEEKLIAGTLSDNDFVRIRDRYKNELENIQCALNGLEQKHDVDIDTAREVLMLSKNIQKAYKKATPEIKRLYLSFFWNKFFIRDKKIVRSEPTEIINTLLKTKRVFTVNYQNDFRLTTNWLRC